MTSHTLCIGLDPGWESFGFAVMKNGTLLVTGNLVPSSYSDLRDFCEDLAYKLSLNLYGLDDTVYVTMERFVAYKNILSSASENILMVIGAVALMFQQGDVSPGLVRAIDWKPEVMKYLARTKDLTNPFTSFDKKFSAWAAAQLTGDTGTLKSTHEADAICLSFLPYIKEYNANRTRPVSNAK